jgi:hypothetical protein
LLAEVVVEAYSELVKTSDFNELKSIVKELTVAQKELAAAQQRTERRVEELASAQQRTEVSLQQLINEHQKTRKLPATTVGYRLEDLAYKGLPPLLERDFGLIVQGKLKRTYLTDNQGKELEVNITGQGLLDGKTVTIIGESKSQLSKNHIDSFVRKRLQRFEGVVQEVFPVLVTYMASSSDVQEYAKTQGIAVYYSYDF